MIINDNWMKDNTPYQPKDIISVLDKISGVCRYVGKGKTKYLNIPVSFDTETTSFYNNDGEKTAIVYVWMLGICGLVIVGRTWDEWDYVYKSMCEYFRTCGKRIIICYVHNLSFDFQFIRKHHEFDKVFAMEKYQPLYARTIEGFEFRCSYRLSGYNLNSVAKNLFHHKIKKLIGDLDYRQIRHNKTPLSEKELEYCLNDAKIVCAYIDELINREGDITNIPLTKTGFVRRDCRNECFKDKNYKYIIQNLRLTADEFLLSKDAFQGGYVHANSDKVDETLIDTTGNDIISSYPAKLFDELYPMSSPKHAVIKSVSELDYYCSNYCCIFQITFHKLRPRYWFDFYLSSSKCKTYGDKEFSNGRIVKAETCYTTITNVDYDIIKYMYKYDTKNIEIGEFIYFERDYLPTPFIKALLTLYQKKTELKGVKGMEIEYQVIKENQNSFYGMTVTSPIRKKYEYDGIWHDGIEPDLNEAIEEYNNSFNRFLYYPWGVFCTAYARHAIWEAIIACGDDHCYTDTDSEKCINFSAHAEFFKQYNERVVEKHKRACKVHGIDINMAMPKNKYGEVKILGAFEIDGKYSRFKTLGAKRYMYEEEGEIHATVAGMSKRSGTEYLIKKYGDDVFTSFSDGIIIPSEYSGRLIHTYIDEIREGELTDMYGITAHYKELSGVHLEPATYTLGMAGDFIRFVKGMKEGEYECLF